MMTPERWRKLKELLAPALEMGPADRVAYVEQVSVGDPPLRNELERLLVAEEKAGTTFLHELARFDQPEDDPSPCNQGRIGLRIGAYQIVEEIGQGGMGAVYRAFRADDQYRKQVAIKLVRAGQDSEAVIRRFKNERQILASLDHPNIARLLDGGTTEDGLPYFVMELIEGLPIDEYCDSHKASISERLKLFRQVCAAVQYAHQHLIIHRDIKPSNILVISDGVPKLLDFGIAKILDLTAVDGQFEPTRTIFRALTPGYASPEQVMDGTITTASDVYSLGVVLYELLAGRSPYRLSTRSPHAIARTVCEVEPEKPSTAVSRARTKQKDSESEAVTPAEVAAARQSSPEKLRKRLEGDLDTIVLKALRKEANRRYASAEEFSRDIRRYLENLPVMARNDTLGYRASKFLTRHKAAVAAATAVIVTLLLGMAVTLREARIARAQQERAERNFKDIRDLSESLMFDVHDAIRDLPGSTPARKILIDKSLKYLDHLANESIEDASLKRELAIAYERVATVQGNPFQGNLGDLAGAAVNYGKAAAIWESLSKANPGSTQDLVGLAGAYRQLAGTVANVGGGDPFDLIQKALKVSERMAGAVGTDARITEELELDYEMAAAIQVKTGADPFLALENHAKALALAEQGLRSNVEDQALKLRVANIRMRMGESLAELGRQKEALHQFATASEIFKSDPDYAVLHRDVARLHSKWGDVLMMGGDSRAALQHFRRAQALLRPLARSDQKNAQVRVELAGTYARVGWALSRGRHPAASLPMFEQAVAMLQPMASNPQFMEARLDLAFTYVWMGELLARIGKTSKALTDYQIGVANFGAVVSLLPWDRFYQSSLAATHSKAGVVLARMGRDTEAAAEYQRALEIARPLASTKPDFLPWYTIAEASFGMGQISRSAQAVIGDFSKKRKNWTIVCNWYRQSFEAWRNIPVPGPITSAGFDAGDPAQVASNLAACGAR